MRIGEIEIDLRDYVFDGLPAGAIESDGDGYGLFGEFGYLAGQDEIFGAAKKAKSLPLPNASNPLAVKTYFAESWRVISANAGAPTPDSAAAYKRIKGLPVAKTSQAMISDCISAGPLPKTPGAGEYYKRANELRAKAASVTGLPAIPAIAGSMAAKIAYVAAEKSKAAASLLVGQAKTTADAAKKNKELATQAAAINKQAQAASVNANTDKAKAIDAIKSVAMMPGNVAIEAGKRASEIVDSVTSIPKSIVESVTSVPKDIAAHVDSVATKTIDAGREVLPGAIEDYSENAKWGIGIGIGTIGLTIIGLGVATVGGGMAYLKSQGQTVSGAYRQIRR